MTFSVVLAGRTEQDSQQTAQSEYPQVTLKPCAIGLRTTLVAIDASHLLVEHAQHITKGRQLCSLGAPTKAVVAADMVVHAEEAPILAEIWQQY